MKKYVLDVNPLVAAKMLPLSILEATIFDAQQLLLANKWLINGYLFDEQEQLDYDSANWLCVFFKGLYNRSYLADYSDDIYFLNHMHAKRLFTSDINKAIEFAKANLHLVAQARVDFINENHVYHASETEPYWFMDAETASCIPDIKKFVMEPDPKNWLNTHILSRNEKQTNFNSYSASLGFYTTATLKQRRTALA